MINKEVWLITGAHRGMICINASLRAIVGRTQLKQLIFG